MERRLIYKQITTVITGHMTLQLPAFVVTWPLDWAGQTVVMH